MALWDGEVICMHIIKDVTICGTALLSRQDIDKLHVQCHRSEHILRNDPLPVPISRAHHLRNVHWDMCSIYCADTILEPEKECLVLSDLIGDREMLIWELDKVMIDSW
jgi:hypothetical protein